jgi:hypothetical protein
MRGQQRRYRTRARAGTALAALLLLSACGGHSGPGGSTAGASASRTATASTGPVALLAPGVKSYDPPLAFGRVPVALPAGAGAVVVDQSFPAHPALALFGTDVYLAGVDGLQMVDGRTGRMLGTVRPKGTVPGTARDVPHPADPLVATVGASTLSLVLDAFVVTVPATGSTPAGTGIELVAVDGSTHQTVWASTLTDLPAWTSAPDAGGLTAAVVGSEGNTAVVSLTDGSHPGSTVAVDLMTHRALWHKDGFAAAAVSGDTVVGTYAKDPQDPGTERAVAGLGLTDGSRQWTGWDVQSHPVLAAAAPGEVVLAGTDYRSGDGFVYLVDAATGARTVLPDSGQDSAACRFDGATSLVCTGRDSTGNHLYGLDAASGRLRWQLPDPAAGNAAGPVPLVTAVWHGVVYGSAGGRPLLLDARTGAERAGTPGIAPVLVDATTALAPGKDDILAAFPATG